MSRRVVFKGSPTGRIARALAYQQAGDLKRAERIYRKVLDADPANDEALHLLGLLEQERGNSEMALHLLRRAIQFRPTDPYLYLNCGVILETRHCFPQAIACYTRAARLAPNDLYPQFALGVAWGAIGELKLSAAHFERALAVAPGTASALDNLAYVLDLDPDATPADRLAVRRRWNDLFAAPLMATAPPHRNDPDPDRPLRVGYVSADFRQHSAWLTFSPVMLEHDRERFEVVAYSGWAKDGDHATAMLREAGIAWRPTAGLDDDALAGLIREDRIDILVDLSGFTAGNRLPVFARRPAPVQVSGWGYATGMSLDCLDGFFTDPVATPPDWHPAQVTEPLLYLPGVIAYNPPADAPEVQPPPALGRDGEVTFCSFNQPKKLSTAGLKLWARVLQAVPNSRLLLKHSGLELPEHESRIRMHFEEAGVETGRVHLFGHSPHALHLASFADADIQLDPTPHGGGVTALEGLWMGVPTLTMLGDRVSSRIAGSLMTTLGLPEYVVGSEDAYVARAVELAADLDRLAEVRAGLRERLASSAICDHTLVDGKWQRSGRRYCEAVEAHYRALWAAWCEGRAREAA